FLRRGRSETSSHGPCDPTERLENDRGDSMKVVALAEAKNALSACVEISQRDRVLLTRHGRPAALIIGVEGEDFEDLMTRSDPEFWRMIERRRRRSKPISGAELRARLGLSAKRRKRSQ